MERLNRRRVPQRLLIAVSWGAALLAGLLMLELGHLWLRPSGQAQPADAIGDFGPAPTFMLTDDMERRVSSDLFRGRVVVANFIYTGCRDICPLLSAQMRTLQERLRQESLLGSQVQLVSFTVDPERDTPAVLRRFAEQYQADPDAWRFLTGPKETLIPLIVDRFRLGMQVLPPQPTTSAQVGGADADAGGGYEVMHSGRFVLIDRQGQIRAYYDGRDFDLDSVTRDIRTLLQ